MMNLDELEKLAKSATPGPWRYFDSDERVYGNDTRDEVCAMWGNKKLQNPENADWSDCNFIASANPETVLKLIAVVRAAANAVYQHDCHESMDNLSRAISALEDE